MTELAAVMLWFHGGTLPVISQVGEMLLNLNELTVNRRTA